MSRRKGWIVGIAVVIPLAGFLCYQVFLSRDVARVGKEESGIESEAPEIAPFSSPRLPKMEEDQIIESPPFPDKTKNLTEFDYSLVGKTPCICGECTETLAKCRCPTALEQMKRMGIIPEKLNR